MNKKIQKSILTIQTWHQKYKNQTIATTSCGATASLMIDLIARSKCNIPIVFIDTGFLFEDTIDYFYRLKRIYKELFFIGIRKDNDKSSFLDEHNSEINNVEICCNQNKITILDDFLLLNDIKCWFSAIRRDQNNTRKDIGEFERNKLGIYKVHPVIEWSSKEVFEYIKSLDLPLHPLFDLGFESIGCEPCTKIGKDRDGRWQGTKKTECGLHL